MIHGYEKKLFSAVFDNSSSGNIDRTNPVMDLQFYWFEFLQPCMEYIGRLNSAPACD